MSQTLFSLEYIIADKWEELISLAEQLLPYTKQAMKIEVAPWITDYVVDMEELYTELTLEKIHNRVTGEDVKTLGHYRKLLSEIKTEVFNEKNQGSFFPDKKSMNLIKKDIGVNTGIGKNTKTQTWKGQKILFKGDPGMGKTTLMKKIAWDWETKFSKCLLLFS